MIFKSKQLTALAPIYVFVAKLTFKSEKYKLRVIKCIMGNGNHTLKMADTEIFPQIIEDNRKKTRLLHNL